MPKLIVGLGNPGKEYEKTRHNVGWRILESLRIELDGNEWKENRNFKADLSEASHDTKIIMAKPLTMMNLSGEAVQKLIRFYKIDAEKDLLVIYDDKDMLFGKLRERSEGSSGGHRGVQSIIEHIGDQFHRLKFGVGHEDQQIPTDAFVLQRFSEEEEKELPELINRAEKLIQKWMKKE